MNARPQKPPDGIPPLPGVYQFVDGKGAVLYVGKAANLKKRVASYFHRTRHSPRIRLMLNAMRDVEVTVVASEHAALLLENNLIKELRPRYNILFRDDKTYPRLRMTAHAYPRLMYARGEATDGGASFGPFPDGGAVRETINILQRVFRLRTCADSAFANRARPCLLHGIGRCSAPCVNAVSPQQYAADVRGAKTLLAGDSRGVETELRARMADAAAQLEFEKAAALRDRLRALSVMRAKHFAEDSGSANIDYIGVHCENDDACVNVVMVRGGRRLGERRFFPEKTHSATPAETMAAFIGQHYAAVKTPPAIVVSVRPSPLPESPPIVASARGIQKRRAEDAARNAAVALSLRRAKRDSAAEKLRILGDRLGIAPPARIECFDVSHSAGESPVAARVVFVDGAPHTSHYRRYAISAKGGDDIAAIGEATGRCYRRIAAEKTPPPDMVLIDGGAAQLAAARAAIPAAFSFPILAIAKGEGRRPGLEKLIAEDGEIMRWDETDSAFHLLQEVRDEAHRFAIGGHRLRRDKKRRTSSLEEIEGVGPKLRRALVGYFGGLRGLRAAGETELIKIRGVSPRLAKRIYDSLHE